jgi:glycosyltransferase involved in cell wall biosynthesis
MTEPTGRISPIHEQIRINTQPGPFHEPAALNRQVPDRLPVRLIAFYLPQFHPIPENDVWWGKGFTEWTNVTRGLPRFRGHVQPRLPGDLGFYDLRQVDVLHRQAELARRYGIGGFCFHHYWFGGRRLLERPLDLFLANPDIDLPFCIDWANENWTRRWDGQDQEVLLEQRYSPEDDVAFARSLLPIVADPRYLRIDGRPLVMVYRPGLLPEPVATARRWRTEFMRAGVADPYLIMAQGFDTADPRLMGFDAAVLFPPHRVAVTSPIGERLEILDPGLAGHILDYGEVAQFAVDLPRPAYKLFRGVCPAWDNEARRPGRGMTLAFADPDKYATWLTASCRAAIAEARHPDERIVFINAWNEWAEGAYLEPDRHYGYAYLAATSRVLRGLADIGEDRKEAHPRSPGRPRIALLSHDAHFHGAQLLALAIARSLVQDHEAALTILLGGGGNLVPQFAAVASTELVPGDFTDADAWRDAASRLVDAGVEAVICNTLVAARALGMLHAAGLRVVLLVHELPSVIEQYNLGEAARAAAEHAAAIVFPSAYVRDRFVEVAGPIRGRVVLRHQPISLRPLENARRDEARAAVRTAWNVPADAPLILGAGFGDLRKGFDLWPALVRRVTAQCPNARFAWVGRVEESLAHWARHDLRTAGLEHHLIMEPPRSDLADVYAAADLYALTSREDPFPSVVLEAMANRLPVVVFEDSGGITDLVREVGGACVPYLDVDAMAAEICRLIRTPEGAAALGDAGRAYVAPNLGFRDYAGLLLDLAGLMPPRITAVVPNYNYARHLTRRLESIWAQTLPVTEIVLLDDASTDGSEAVSAALVARSPVPIRVVRNKVNSGSVSRQWARGVELANSELVWIAEADDVAEPRFLEMASAAFRDPAVVLSYCESRMIGEDDTVLAENYRDYVADIDPVRWTRDYRANGRDEIALALAVKNTIPNVSAALFRTEALRGVLRDHLDDMVALRNAADWLCYLRLLAQGGAIAFTAQSLNNHRRHEWGVTISTADRRHLDEIAAMQRLAGELVAVTLAGHALASTYLSKVAGQFGLELASQSAEKPTSGPPS